MDAELKVTFGNTWYRLVTVAATVGVIAAMGTYVTGREMFKAGFRQTELVVVDN